MLNVQKQKGYSVADLKQLLTDLQTFDTHTQNDTGAFIERYTKLVLVLSEEWGNPALDQGLPGSGESLFRLFEQVLELIEHLLIVHINYRHGTAFITSKGKSFGVTIRPNLVLSQEQMREVLASLVKQIGEPNAVKAAVLERCSAFLYDEQRSEKRGVSYWQLVAALEQIESEFDDQPWARCLSGLAQICLPGRETSGVESLFQALLLMQSCMDRLDRALLCRVVSDYCMF